MPSLPVWFPKKNVGQISVSPPPPPLSLKLIQVTARTRDVTHVRGSNYVLGICNIILWGTLLLKHRSHTCWYLEVTTET
jgi:hypothetical protein